MKIPREWIGLLIVLISILIGLGLAGDYGESWDEAGTARLGEAALASYSTGVSLPSGLGDLARHGPIVAAFVEWGSGRLRDVRPDWTPYHARHVLFFCFFLGATAGVYALARRWIDRAPAFLTAALFATQPLLFGHGFINPSDGPFLSLFCASVLAGLVLSDRILQPDGPGLTQPGRAPEWRDLVEGWRLADVISRRWIVIWLALFSATAVEVLWQHRVVLPILQGWVRAAYEGKAWEPVNRLFRAIAEDAAVAPLEAYYGRLWFYYSQVRWAVLAGLSLPGLSLTARPSVSVAP